jgi:hypothetical protein
MVMSSVRKPMPIRTASFGFFRREGCALTAAALLFVSAKLFAAAGSPPPLRFPFQSLGIQLLDGSSGLGPVAPTTVHFVDDRHVLVTYAVRRLMKRIPDDPPEDNDHTIAAVLVDLDTGKAVARHEWRLHDYQRFMWPLGHGRFLLRQRNSFTTLAPLAHLASGKPFEESPFLKFDRRIVAVLLSPEADFLTVETGPPPQPAPKPKKKSPMADFNAAIAPPSNATPGPEPDPEAEAPALHRSGEAKIQIIFFRINYSSDGEGVASPRIAGRAVSDQPVVVPLNANGYISTVPEPKSKAHGSTSGWETDYNTFTGKAYELPLYNSSCHPGETMISRSELLIFGCRVKDNQRYFAAFNLLGEEMWEKGLYDAAPIPMLGFSPGSGRLAVNRLIVSTAAADENLVQLAHDHATSQMVDVYQINSGRQLLHLPVTPIEVASQNFSLSPDGMGLAVVNNGAIEVYELPEPTAKEKADNKKVLAAAPVDAEVPVQLGAQQINSADDSTSPVPPATAPTAGTRPVATTPALPAQSDEAAQPPKTLGDAPPEARRKPPTLYNEPGDNVPANSQQDAPR